MTPFVTALTGCTCPRCTILDPITAIPPHEVWDRTIPPPTAVPAAPAITPAIPIVPVGTPLADVIGLPGNPFLG